MNDIDDKAIMSATDFVIPVKIYNVIVRTVLEAINLLYNPRRIIIITPLTEIHIFKKLINKWNIQNIEFIEEETFFIENYNLSIDQIYAEYDTDNSHKHMHRDPGWWYQQLIKLGSSTQIKDISDTYVVWDADLIPIKKWKLYYENKWYVAILQDKAKSEFNNIQYAQSMYDLTDMNALSPDEGTYVTHHMVFNKKYVIELLNLMTNKISNKILWPLLIMSKSKQFYRFSEYKTYCTFMKLYHPDEFNYHPLHLYGNGIRIRDEIEGQKMIIELFGNNIADGISYIDLLNKVKDKDISYLQLEHITLK
jgi:hypothetical protein